MAPRTMARFSRIYRGSREYCLVWYYIDAIPTTRFLSEEAGLSDVFIYVAQFRSMLSGVIEL